MYEICRNCREEVVWWALFADIGQTAYKGILGTLSGSHALIADSLHSGADVIASAVTMSSVKLSSKAATEDYPYGFGNVQFISSSIVGLILIIGALYLMYASISVIVSGPIEAPSVFAVFGAGISIVANELLYRYQGCVGRQNNSPAIIANALDNRSDAISSVGVLIGITIAVLGFPIADNLAAICVAVMVGKIGVELNIQAVEGLMDSSVDVDVLVSAYDIATQTPKVQEVQYLRGRNVGEEIFLDISICVVGDLKIYESDLIVEAVKKKIISNIRHVKDVQISVVPAQESAKKITTGRQMMRVAPAR